MTGKVHIALNGEFTAIELEEILRDLAVARASTEPAVPDEPPSVLSHQEALEQEDALFAIRSLAGGGARIWLRSEGFGWLAFTLSSQRRKELAVFLSKETGHARKAH